MRERRAACLSLRPSKRHAKSEVKGPLEARDARQMRASSRDGGFCLKIYSGVMK
jgi:hypothetical protein